jgi:hypothetical protein
MAYLDLEICRENKNGAIDKHAVGEPEPNSSHLFFLFGSENSL